MKTLELAPTKEKLLESATALMLEKGYEATSVDEICQKANVTKGSFFHYFKTKEALGKELIHYFSNRMNLLMADYPPLRDPDPLKRIYAYIDFSIEMSRSCNMKGCLVGTLTQELYDSHPEIRKSCCSRFDQIVGSFKRAVLEAKKKYKPSSKIDAQGLAETFVAIAQGSIVLGKAQKDFKVLGRTFLQFKNYVRSLFTE